MLLMTSSPSADRKRAPPTLALHTPPSLARSVAGYQQCQVASANQHDMNSNLAPPSLRRDASETQTRSLLDLGGASDRPGSHSGEQHRAVLKSMHAEEDALYEESRSPSLARWFVGSFVGSSKGHFLTTPLTPSRFLTSVGQDRRRRVETPGDQLGRQPGCLLGGQYNVMEKKSGCQSGGEGPIHAASQMSQQFRFEVQRERQAALEQSW